MQVSRSQSTRAESARVDSVVERTQRLPSRTSLRRRASTKQTADVSDQCSDDAKMQSKDSLELSGADPADKSSEWSNEPTRSVRRPAVWGRTPGRKNLSMESVEVALEDEADIQKLECIKEDLETRIETEAQANSHLQESLRKRKHDLLERRLSLEKDVARLQEQLQKEMELRKTLEAGLKSSQLPLSVSPLVDDKVKSELEEIIQAEADVKDLKQKADDLELQLSKQQEQNSKLQHDTSNQLHQNPNNQLNLNEKQMDGGSVAIPCTSEDLERSKHDSYSDKPDSDKDKKQDSSTLNQTASGVSTSTVDTGTNKLASTSRKSSTKGH